MNQHLKSNPNPFKALKSNLPLVTAINAPIKHKARDTFFTLSIFSLYIILENNAINRGEVYTKTVDKDTPIVFT